MICLETLSDRLRDATMQDGEVFLLIDDVSHGEENVEVLLLGCVDGVGRRRGSHSLHRIRQAELNGGARVRSEDSGVLDQAARVSQVCVLVLEDEHGVADPDPVAVA